MSTAHMLYVVAIALPLGLALLVWGRVHGRRLDRHPVCRKCRYDLFGHADVALSQCPECGAGLGPKRAIRIGNRRPAKRFILSGLVLCAIGVGFGLTVGIPAAKTFNWYRPLPLWMVIDAAEDAADPPRAAGGQDALLRRHWQGKLSAAQYEKLVALALAKQADRSLTWDPFWGDMIEHARHAGHVTDEQWQQYFTEGCRYELVMPNSFFEREDLYYEFRLIGSERLARTRAGNVDYRAMAITELGPEYATEHSPVPFVFTGTTADGEVFNATVREIYFGPGSKHTIRAAYYYPLIILPAGQYKLHVTLAWYVSTEVSGTKHQEWIDNVKDAPVTAELDYEASFEVVEKPTP